MKLTALKPMTDFVSDILEYTHESHNYERGINLIRWYSELLNLPLSLDMLNGKEPLFPYLSKMEISIFEKSNEGIDLKKVEDLCKMAIVFNIHSKLYITDLFDMKYD